MRQMSREEYLQLRLKQATEDDVSLPVEEIIEVVRSRGDAALYDFTFQFDKCDLQERHLCVDAAELHRAANSGPDVRPQLKRAAENIWAYHATQVENSRFITRPNGVVLGLRVNPLSRVGLYVPGGRAAYPSSVLMNAIPAQVAGVKDIALVTPPTDNGSIHSSVAQAAEVLGLKEVYRVGGAQAIAALAYGTQQIKRVDKIVGPGNAFVAEAKRQVFGTVDIDMVAGPSEILIIAEPGINPQFVAADLLAQAEHDPDAVAIAVTWDEGYAELIIQAVRNMVALAPRQDIIREALARNGAVVVVKSLAEALELANQIAPEHLELMLQDPWASLGSVENAGAVFLGAYSPESLGDYWAGSNHVLPTGGTARFSSPLGVYDFYKRSSVLYYPQRATQEVIADVVSLAQSEGLYAHAEAIRIRGS